MPWFGQHLEKLEETAIGHMIGYFEEHRNLQPYLGRLCQLSAYHSHHMKGTPSKQAAAVHVLMVSWILLNMNVFMLQCFSQSFSILSV